MSVSSGGMITACARNQSGNRKEIPSATSPAAKAMSTMRLRSAHARATASRRSVSLWGGFNDARAISCLLDGVERQHHGRDFGRGAENGAGLIPESHVRALGNPDEVPGVELL